MRSLYSDYVRPLLAGYVVALGASIATIACFERVAPVVTPVIIDVDSVYPGPSGVVEVFPDDSPEARESPCGKGCANLARIPCREGYTSDAGISCYRACVTMAQHQQVPTQCWSLAASAEEARTCGGVRCLTP